MARRSAECARNGRGAPKRLSDNFLQGLADSRSVTFVSHIQPDPDAIGSMLGLSYLIQEKLGLPTRLTRDGHIHRAENRALVQLLRVPLEPIEEVSWETGDVLVMVDSQPHTGRHSFDPELPIYAVIDHHDTKGDCRGVPFIDIRGNVGATCSLVTQYLREQELAPPRKLATALFYGIETEIGGYPREATPLDDEASVHLFPLADKDLLAKIRNARLPQCYFECMLQGLQNSFIYDRLIISWVNELSQPELAAEVVDFLVRFEDVDWAFCAGVFQDKLVLSARASFPHADAGEILRQVVGKLGKAGGHERRAGGCIPLTSNSATAIEQLQSELRRRLLKVLRIDECRGQRLVSRKEMLQNLSM